MSQLINKTEEIAKFNNDGTINIKTIEEWSDSLEPPYIINVRQTIEKFNVCPKAYKTQLEERQQYAQKYAQEKSAEIALHTNLSNEINKILLKLK